MSTSEHMLYHNQTINDVHSYLYIQLNLNTNKLKFNNHNITQIFKYNILVKDNNRMKNKPILEFTYV